MASVLFPTEPPPARDDVSLVSSASRSFVIPVKLTGERAGSVLFDLRLMRAVRPPMSPIPTGLSIPNYKAIARKRTQLWRWLGVLDTRQISLSRMSETPNSDGPLLAHCTQSERPGEQL